MLPSHSVKDKVKDIFSELLGTPAATIGDETNFLDLGADSFVLVSASRRVEREWGVKLTVRELFETASSVARVASRISETAMPAAVATPVTPVADFAAVAPSRSTPDVAASVCDAPAAKTRSRAWHGTPGGAALPPADLTESQRAFLADFTRRFALRTRSSKTALTTSRHALCNNRKSASGFRAETKEMTYPILVTRAEGAHLQDVDGNTYVDLSMAYGATLFGHNPPFLKKALADVLECGYAVGPECPIAGDVARMVARITGLPRVLFANSGTEAVMTAIRIARAATQRDRVVFFQNSYHGHSDTTLVGANPERLVGPAVPGAPGVPASVAGEALLFPYGKQASLDALRASTEPIAAIVVEPVQNRRPDLHPAEFLRELRAIADEKGAALVFDEVLVGFRIAAGGAQSHFGVRADIATYGKVVGGGLPIGVVAGEAWCMDAVDGGTWEFGDDSAPSGQTTFTAGTFCKHPLAMAAARATLAEIDRRGNSLYDDLNARSEAFFQRLKEIFARHRAPLSIARFGSFFRFAQEGNLSLVLQPLELDLFFFGLILRGVYVWEGKTCFLSTAHTDADLALVERAVDETLSEMTAAGFWRPRQALSVGHGSDTSVRACAPLVRNGYVPVRPAREGIGFSLSFFGDYGNATGREVYDSLVRCARFAESNGFDAIWTPERHFSSFGGFSPNPSVLNGALAVATSTIALRASVVLPLHHPARLAEEWAVVDHMSGGGRVGLAFAPGWQANDFVLAPEAWDDRKTGLERRIGVLQRLWQGDKVSFSGANGKETAVEVFPKPTSETLPLWLTTLGDRAVFEKAGALGVGVLTNLLNQSIEGLRANIAAYKDARARAGLDPERGHVTVLLHTFVGAPGEDAREKAFPAFVDYIAASIGLFQKMAVIQDTDVNFDLLGEADRRFIIERAARRLLEGHTLIGSPEHCEGVARALADAGADEIACFVDFGLPCDVVEAHLPHLAAVLAPCRTKRAVTRPLTDDQTQLLALEHLEDADTTLNGQPLFVRVEGTFDRAALEAAFDDVVEEHEALRGVFDWNASTQTFLPDPPTRLTVLQPPTSGREAADPVAWLAGREQSTPFGRDASVRLTACPVDGGVILAFNVHHVMCDGVGAMHALEQIVNRYVSLRDGRPLVRPPSLPFTAFLDRLDAYMKSPAYRREVDAWRPVLADGFAPLDLGGDLPAPTSPSSRAESVGRVLAGKRLAMLRENARAAGTTDFVAVLACWMVFLARVTGQARLATGVPFDGRGLAEGRNVVGNCVVNLPIVVEIGATDTLRDVVRAVRERVLSAYENQNLRLSDLLSSTVSGGATAKASTVFAWDKIVLSEGASFLPQSKRHCKSVFGLEGTDIGSALQLDFVYRVDTYSQAMARSLSEAFDAVLDAFSTHGGLDLPVSKIDLTTQDRKERLVGQWCGPRVDVDASRTFVSEFESCVDRSPDAPCLAWRDRVLTYAEVDARANQVAHALLARGVERGARVGVILDRSFAQIVALLGTLKAGATFVPIDPSYPAERRAVFLSDAGMRALIALAGPTSGVSARGAGGHDLPVVLLDDHAETLSTPQARPCVDLNSDAGAYCIYTSGSTGRPKGVVTTHRALVNLGVMLDGLLHPHRIPLDRWAWNASFSFDSCIKVFAQLARARLVHILDDDLRRDPEALVRYLVRHDVDVVDLTPSQAALVLQEATSTGVTLPTVLLGGEPIDAELWKALAKHHAGTPRRGFNLYGTTECAVDTTGGVIDADVRPHIGSPLANAECFVLDGAGALVPVGVRGELHVGGVSVSQGYLANEELTRERFVDVDLPLVGVRRLYRTGDLVRWLPDGRLESVGRADAQVKIRGHRIEPGEIEAALRASVPTLREVAVVARRVDGESHLVAHVVPGEVGAWDPEVAMDALLAVLPDVLVPRRWEVHGALPRTPSGKIDRMLLAGESVDSAAAGAPRGRLEPGAEASPQGDPDTALLPRITGMWREVLKAHEVRPEDNFFRVGGSSLSAIRLRSKLKAEFGVGLTLREIYGAPTVRQQAALMASKATTTERGAASK